MKNRSLQHNIQKVIYLVFVISCMCLVFKFCFGWPNGKVGLDSGLDFGLDSGLDSGLTLIDL